jgi:uncharacterized repeat protein (TIGR02543 family)
MNTMHRYHRLFLGLSVILSGLVFLAIDAVADSITVSETWKDSTVAGVYASSQDTGTFNASLTVPGLSSLTANSWSNLLVTINSSSLITGEDSWGGLGGFTHMMADATNFGGTVSSTRATFYFQLSDTNGNWVNAYKMSFSRSGNTLTIAGQTLNPASLGSLPWSIVAWNYLDYSGLQATFTITDQADCEVVLQDATTLDQYADIVQTIYISGTNTITYDPLGDELNNVRVSGAADFTRPTLTAVSPSGTLTTTTDLLTVQVKATDNVGVSSVTFYVNGLDCGSGVSGVSNLWSMNFALRPGSNVIQTLATDLSGNNSTTNRLAVTYVNKQTTASLITFSEHWLDSSPADSLGNPFVSQDIGTLNAALQVPGLQSLSASTWSNLIFTVSFGDIDYTNSLAAADVLTATNAMFYLNTIYDPNGNLLTDVQMSIARSGSTLVLAYETGNPTYDLNNPIIADFYLGFGGSITDAELFTLTLLDGSTMNPYANVSRTVFITGTDSITYYAQTNELDNIQIFGAADYKAPTIQITAPTSGQRCSNAVFTVTGKAGDNVGVSDVFYSVNNSAWAMATTGNNWSNWTAQVALTPGTNTLAAYAVDTSGNVSATNTVSFVYILSAVLTVHVNPGGTVVTNYSGMLLPIGQTYSMTAKTNVGFAFSGWTGSITTNSPKLTFVMASNLVFTANFADIAKPTLRITAPANGQKMTNALAHVKGTANDNWKVGDVWYQLNGGAWNPAITTNAWTNWSVTLPLLSGTNTVKAYAVDLGGNTSATNTVSVTSSNTFKMQLSFASTEPMASNGLSFNLDLSAGINGTIQVSSNLVNWTVLTNFVGTNETLNFRDSAATDFNRRFYRAVTK